MSIKEQISKLRRIPVAVLLLLCVGFVLNMIHTIPYAFSAFADAFKAQFNITQTQANIFEASLTSTTMFMLPAGLIQKTYGNTTMIIIALLMVTSGWTALWLCVLLRYYVRRYPYIVGVALAIAGHSKTYSEIFLFAFMPQLVDAEYAPIVIAAIDIGDEIGIFGISLIYETFFINGHYDDPENQSLASFLLLALLLEWLANIGMAVMLVVGQKYRRDKNNAERECREIDLPECSLTSCDDANICDKKGETNGETCSDKLEYESPNKPVNVHSRSPNSVDRRDIFVTTSETSESISNATSTTNLIKRVAQSTNTKFPARYLLIATCTTLPISMLNFESLNITYLSRSLSLVYLDYYLVTLTRVCTVAGKLLMSLVLALGRNYFYIYEASIIGISLFLFLFQLLYLIKGTNVVVFFTSFIVNTTIQGAEALMLPLLINAYYPTDFAFKYSCAWTLICGLLALIQIIFGALYDSEIPLGGGQYCYGYHCLASTFIIMTSCSVIALLAALSLLLMKINKKRRLGQQETPRHIN